MYTKTIHMITAAIALSSAIPAQADVAWEPSDFDGAYVRLVDDATNGCWTNLNVVKKYAEAQLILAGFKVLEAPDFKNNRSQLLLENNSVEYVLNAKARRWNDGTCIGYFSTTFLGAVRLKSRPDTVITNPLGQSYVWQVWDKKNLNIYAFDQVKQTIKLWIDAGADFNITNEEEPY